MPDDVLSLSSGFPEVDEAAWIKLVEQALKGGSPDRLNSKTYDGIVVKALYRDTDNPSGDDAAGFPGAAPFLRGSRPGVDVFLPWDIRQVSAHPDPARANAEILKDLENGVTSIELRLDADAERGVCVRTANDLSRVLDGVMLDLAPLGLDASGASATSSIEAAVILATHVSGLKARKADLRLAFNVDPIGALSRTGHLPESLENSLSGAASFVKDASADFPAATFLRADARPIHEAGGSEAQELAALVACGAAYMRAQISAGLTPDQAARSILFTLSVGPDYLVELAKIRAARRMWSKVAEAFGATASGGAMQLQAVSSRRMLTARDPWVNILRATAAGFAAGVGGADIVTIRPFTDALGLPSKLARRIARNTQVIAQEESRLGAVIDPAGGAWSVGKLADDLALAGWERFQAVEACGGIGDALRSGLVQQQVAEIRSARLKDVSTRKTPITGVSDFPLLVETAPEIEHADGPAIAAAAAADTGIKPAGRDWRSLLDAAGKGATLSDLSLDGEAEEVDPLWPMRVSAPFERLRDHADAHAKRTGKRPSVFLACLGPLAEHTARATFATNFFAAGGIDQITASGSADELAAAYAGSGAHIACICGADARYEAEAEDAAKALKAAGVGRLYLAGKPASTETMLRDAGVDEFIYIGVNVVESLELAHSELGLTLQTAT